MLAGLDLRIEPGEKVLLAGASGSGKSTLLRAIAGLLQTADVGELSGEVSVDGRHPQERAGTVGLLLQDPSAAVVADRVGRDVAFGLENTRTPPDLMPGLVAGALRAAGFPYDERRSTRTLSGGETQRLALAGALALRPQVLLLDEPTSMLDEDNAARVRRSVLAACEQHGTTLVVVEHQIGPWVEHLDRCVVLDRSGAVIADGRPREVLARLGESLAAEGIWVPDLPAPRPLAVDPVLVTPTLDVPVGEVLLAAERVGVTYRSPFGGSAGEPRNVALDDVSCVLHEGESVVLGGGSGAGKSTLLAALAGLQAPDRGAVHIHPRLAGRKGRVLHRLTSPELAARVAWVPQLPEHGLVTHTVLDELLVSARALGQPPAAAEQRARALLEHVGLAALAGSSVHHLSGGEQRRLVVAAALVHGPAGLLLDEPTVGQDRNTWAAVTGLCLAARDAGAAVGVATHDAVATHALVSPGGRTLTLERGRLT